MRHVRMLGLCLIAVVAVVAMAATSASALPEWGRCVVQEAHEGKYTDSNCTKKAKAVGGKLTGEFEFKKGTAEITDRRFTGENVGSGGVLTTELFVCEGGADKGTRVPKAKCVAEGGEALEFLGKSSIECTSEKNTGEAAGTKEVKNVSVIFRGCLLLGALPCSNAPEEGEIVVNPLKGSLGYINKSKKEVGILLEPQVKHGEFAKFNCGGRFNIVVGVGNEKEGAAYSPEKTGGYDGLISPITPVNTMSNEFTQVFTTNENVENVPSKFEGKHIELLENYLFNAENPNESSLWSKAAESITNVNHAAEAVEIKA